MARDVAEKVRCPEKQRLQQLLSLHEVALGRMAHGLLMIDGGLRVALFNRRFLDMYGLSSEVVRTGMSVRDLFAHSYAVGNFPYITAEHAWEHLLERLAAGEPFSVSQTLPNGRMIEAYCEPLEGGGLVCLYKDVTDQRALEDALRMQAERTHKAIELTSQGIAMFDADERLIMANDPYYRIYRFDRAVVMPGISFREIAEHAHLRGKITDRPAAEIYADRRSHVRNQKRGSRRWQLSDGRIVNVIVRPTSDGGWISYHEDVSARLAYENALREQNLRFDAALNHMAHGLCMFDADQRLIVCNAQYCELYGLDPTVVKQGITYRDMLDHWASNGDAPLIPAEELYARRMANLERRDPITAQIPLRSGRVIEATLRHAPGGGWVSASEDVTERLRNEDRLREQNLRFDAALENMAQGLAMFDSDLRIAVCNRHFLDIWGFDPTVVRPGMAFADVVRHSQQCGNHPPDVDPEEIARQLARQLGHENSFIVRRRRDGAPIAISSRAMANGGWVVTYEDVSEREHTAEVLAQQNMRFDAALNNMSHGLAMFDAEHRLIVCNQRYMEIFGCDTKVIRPGITAYEVFAHGVASGIYPGLTADELMARRLALLAERRQVTYDQQMADGRVLAITICPMGNGGWVGTFEDITERRRLEAERAAALARISEQNLRFDAAINHMSQGLAMFDAEHRLIVCNENYLTMFGADPDVVKPGVTIRAIFEHGVALGLYGDTSVDELIARRLAAFAEGRPTTYDQALSNGRTIRLAACPMVNGGWVATYEDVTEARRLENERTEALGNLREQHRRFDAALSNMSHGLVMIGADHRLIVCNQPFIEMLGLSPDIAKPGATLWDLVRESVAVGNRPGLTEEEAYARYIADLKPYLNSVKRRMPDGRTLLVTRSPMENGGWVAIYEDITERERATAALTEQNQRFDAALNHMPHGLCMLDDESRMIVCNQRYLDLFGFSPDVVKPGISMREIMIYSATLGNHPVSGEEHYRNYVEELRAGRHVMHRTLTDGRTILVMHRPNPHGGWVLTFEDITERLKAEEQISHMARHDALTGLPNRLLFRERMAEGLERVEANAKSMGILCLDLDNFKSVNDTLGHPVGDQLLTTVARRISCILGPEDVFARLGGDEFAILQQAPQPASAMELSRRIIEIVSQPIFIDGHEINTGVSVGIAIAPSDGLVGDHLMKCADLALYRAKADGRSRFRLFETDMDTRIREKRALELDLRKALAAGEFALHYQPQMRASDSQLMGMEALLRWTHAERGPVSPSEFIPLAEETGLIIPLGEWVLRRACEEAASWPCDIRVAVNLSPVQFKARGLVGTVANALATSGLRSNRLELEITEAVLLQEDEATLAMLHQLRALGVRISMDDFGTGYSSLSYLRSFPFDKIKIDRSFVADLDRGRDSAAIIRAIAGMGASLGIDTTAEGVETAEQFERVRRDGCTEVQGYYFSPPRPAAEIVRLIARWRPEQAVA